MSKIIVNAPIQNTEFSPDQSLGKVVPLFVADWARVNMGGYQSDSYDLWNNVLANHQSGYTEDSYREHSHTNLEQKYASYALSDWRKEQSAQILTDSDKGSFEDWTLEVIEKALMLGDLEVKEQRVQACSGCGATRLGHEGACDKPCPHCQEKNTQTRDRIVLVSRVTSDVLNLSNEASGNKNHDCTYEGNLIQSKRRLGGVSLKAFDLDGESLDPKVGLGLLVLYAAHLADADEVDAVAARSTASHNLAALYSVINSQVNDLPRLSMKPISKAPVEHIQHYRREGVLGAESICRALNDTLPPHLLAMRHDMSPLTFDRIVFSRRGRNT